MFYETYALSVKNLRIREDFCCKLHHKYFTENIVTDQFVQKLKFSFTTNDYYISRFKTRNSRRKKTELVNVVKFIVDVTIVRFQIQ